jgi:hypothetical protein
MNTKTIWGTIAVLSAFVPTVSFASPPTPDPSQQTPSPTAVINSASSTISNCQSNTLSSNCLNSATQALQSANIQINPAVSSTLATANTVANFDFNAKLNTLTSSCNNISDPMACVSGAKGILGSIGGSFGTLGNTALDSLTSSVTGMLNRGLADLATQFPFLAGLFGGSSAPPTSQDIAKTNTEDVQKIAASVLAVKGKAIGDVLQHAQDTGEYTPGVANEMIQQGSKAIAASMTGKAALQANQQNINAAAADVKTTTSIAETNYDSSLDALAGANKSLAALARGQERINSALIESKTTQGQLLEQTTLVRDTINQANIRNDAAIQRNVETQTSLQCFQASMYRRLLTCK